MRSWWRSYQTVNRQFADTVAAIAPPGGTVWVNDYHLMLVPKLLRSVRPDLRIGFFLHIPFPSIDLFATLPWRTELVHGSVRCRSDRLPDRPRRHQRHRRDRPAVAGARRLPRAMRPARTVEIDAFPISIDFEYWDDLGRRAVAEAGRHRRSRTRPIPVRRRRPPRLHEGHRPASASLRRAARREPPRPRALHVRADLGAEPRGARCLRDRAGRGRPDHRRGEQTAPSAPTARLRSTTSRPGSTNAHWQPGTEPPTPSSSRPMRTG